MLGELHSRRSADIGQFESFFIAFYVHVYIQYRTVQYSFRAHIDLDLLQVLFLDICSASGWRGKYLLKKGNWACFTSCCIYIVSRKSRDVLDSPLFLVFVDLLQIRCISNHCHLFQHSCVIFFVFTKTKYCVTK